MANFPFTCASARLVCSVLISPALARCWQLARMATVGKTKRNSNMKHRERPRSRSIELFVWWWSGRQHRSIGTSRVHGFCPEIGGVGRSYVGPGELKGRDDPPVIFLDRPAGSPSVASPWLLHRSNGLNSSPLIVSSFASQICAPADENDGNDLISKSRHTVTWLSSQTKNNLVMKLIVSFRL
jgi:hypothetical protein